MGLQQYACRCLNIIISSTTATANRDAAPTDPIHFEKLHVGDEGVKVSYSQLTLRRRTSVEADQIQWNTVSCLLCRTVVYRVASEITVNFELRDGPVVTSGEESAEGEILRGRDGFIEVNIGLEGCIDAEAISAAHNDSTKYSETFDLLLPASPRPSTLPSTPQRPSSPQPPATPRSLLPTLPPLFHPPPYSPSHPVFVRLSKTASITSAQYRAQAERAIEAFIEAQVAEVLEKERHLRGQVEVIWSRWRDNWKQEADSGSPSEGHHPTLSGVVPVREFSPTKVSESGPVIAQGSVAPQAIPARRSSVHAAGPSMLSQSLRQSNFVPPPQSVTSTPSPQLRTPVNGVKNPLDDSFAVSASLQIRNIDAMRARETEEKRRKRLSLGGKPTVTPAVPEEQPPEDDKHVTPTSRNGVAEGKRKVTFQADVKEEDGGSQPVPRRGDGTDGADDNKEQTETPVLFDLDDDEEPDQPSVEADHSTNNAPEEPTTPRTVAQLKAKSKANKGSPKIGNKSAVPALLTVNLGPSPGPARPKPSPKSPSAAKSESPRTRTARPGEEKLLELVAANYPSHRAAWRENGKAWELFDARRKFADSPDSASMTSSEDSNGGKWNNPSQFATSLPIGIAAGPLAPSDEREPKTSLHNEPGALVPPLRSHHETPRQTRERTYALRDLARSVDPGPVLELQAAEDAEEDTDEEDSVLGEISDAERVRRRTMKIVQRQSGVPDAGMWRSVAS
ncbi:unnamed protein product [Rhizoctonia solani]|uniref:Uncharacterized protein n=1 Tax=Rhizoctonia solani TaxID=456999 RepID=A0A8H3AYR0_9AGAM|nr:unnamed protein product [Rhizoctonia solani]